MAPTRVKRYSEKEVKKKMMRIISQLRILCCSLYRTMQLIQETHCQINEVQTHYRNSHILLESMISQRRPLVRFMNRLSVELVQLRMEYCRYCDRYLHISRMISECRQMADMVVSSLTDN